MKGSTSRHEWPLRTLATRLPAQPLGILGIPAVNSGAVPPGGPR